MPDRLHKVSRFAPGFEADALRMYLNDGMQAVEIEAEFRRRHPNAKLGRSSFFRWWLEVKKANGVKDKRSRLAVNRSNGNDLADRIAVLEQKIDALIKIVGPGA